MTSDRLGELIERLLAEAEEAVVTGQWDVFEARCRSALAIQPTHTDALSLLAAAQRGALSDESTNARSPQFSAQVRELLAKRPTAWEYRLFGQALADELEYQRRAAADEVNQIDEYVSKRAFPDWARARFAELNAIVTDAARVVNADLPIAFGAPGEPGDADRILGASRALGEAYHRMLRWRAWVQHVRVDSGTERLRELAAAFSDDAVRTLPEFSARFTAQLAEGLAQIERDEQGIVLDFKVNFTAPDAASFAAEARRVLRS